MLRTTAPSTYLPPTRGEMKEAAEKVGLETFSRDLVSDLTNLSAGGQLRLPADVTAFRSELLREVEETLPAPDKDGEWKLPDGGYTKNRQEVVMKRSDELMKYHQNVSNFLETVDLGQFPGKTPLEQAMSLLKLLSKKEGGGGEEGGDPLPIFQEKDGEKVAKQLSQTMEEVESLDQGERELLDPQDKWGSNSDLDKLKVAEDFVSRKGFSKILEVSRHLDTLSKLRVRRQVKPIADPEGDDVRSRPLKGLSELARVNKSAWATRAKSPAYFLYQAVSGQLSVRERVTRTDKKQVLFILLDGSGSMSDGSRHYKATGVVMNRLKAVLGGDAEVHLAVFDDKMYEVRSARTSAEAKALMQSMLQQNYGGGGTDIPTAIRSAKKWIEEEMQSRGDLYRPEIVILTDDDSSVSSLSAEELAGFRLHGFAMETENPNLVSLCRETGGVGVENM